MKFYFHSIFIGNFSENPMKNYITTEKSVKLLALVNFHWFFTNLLN